MRKPPANSGEIREWMSLAKRFREERNLLLFLFSVFEEGSGKLLVVK